MRAAAERYFPKRPFPDNYERHRNLKAGEDFTPERVIEHFRLRVNGLLHVGANDGDSVNLYNLIGREVEILAIEPLGQPFDRLKTVLASFPRATGLNCAISAFEGSAKINVASNGGQSSSLLSPKIHLRAARHVTFGENETVRCERLETVLENRQNLNFWLVDTQGTELDVLRSAGATIAMAEYIFCEINRAEVYAGCTKVWQLDEFLGSKGFERKLTRWFNYWGDALYVRKQVLG